MSSLTNNAHQGDPRYKLTLLGHLLDSEALQSKDEQDQISALNGFQVYRNNTRTLQYSE